MDMQEKPLVSVVVPVYKGRKIYCKMHREYGMEPS